MESKKISGYLMAYSFWIIVLLLAIWLAVISQTTLLSLAAVYYVDDLYSRQTLIRFLDKSYMFIIGLAWLALMIISEEVFRKAVKKVKLFQKFSIVVGIELLAIFIFDFILLFLQNWAFDPVRFLMLAFELVAGLLLVFYWRKTRTVKPA